MNMPETEPERLRTIIAGSRTITDPAMLDAALIAWGWCTFITAVVCGEAPGADTLGRQWADQRDIPVLSFPADWKAHGKAAGPIRNEQMADSADALLALWDGQSKGTAHMITTARRYGIKVYVYTVQDYERRRRVLSGAAAAPRQRARAAWGQR